MASMIKKWSNPNWTLAHIGHFPLFILLSSTSVYRRNENLSVLYVPISSYIFETIQDFISTVVGNRKLDEAHCAVFDQ